VVKKRQNKDPYASREAQNYQNPIPSREFIIQRLTESGQLLSFGQLAQLLELHLETDLEALGFRLRAMVRDGQLIYTRKQAYGLPQKMSLQQGTVIGHPDGYGFVKLSETHEKWFFPARYMREVIHGDVVLVRDSGQLARGYTQAILIEVLQRNTEEIVGRFHSQNGAHFVIPESKNIQQHIIIPPKACNDAVEGDVVMVQLIAQPDKHQSPVGNIIEVIGQHMDPGLEIDIALRVHDIPDQWSEEVTQQVDAVPSRVMPSEIAERRDLRQIPFVTIDGEDAKDFDDAVYCELTQEGWVLYVAIADVAHYVAAGSALDNEASKRGNSVYFPGRVIPMLPFKLSAGICSLKPEVNRLALVCQMNINKKGKVCHYEFFEATICSKARLTYNKVAKILLEHDPYLCQRYGNLVTDLGNLYDLFQVLYKNRQRRGALELDIPETKIIFSRDKKIKAIERVERNHAHRLIEEFMLAANVCAAEFLVDHEIPGLFRVHPRPQLENLGSFREFLASHGFKLGGADQPSSLDYAKLLRQISKSEEKTIIQTALLRSLSQAVYQADNIGHFGLAYEKYTHYTSPIRRYPDLVVHRAIKHHLTQKESNYSLYNKLQLDKLGTQCSMTERRADEATRDVIEWLKCEFMQDKIGDTFTAKVSTVTAFGLFVTLDNFYVDGLVHVTSLPNDYYHFDAIHYKLIGERSHHQYKIGDSLSVRLTRVDLDERKIDFDLGEDVVKRAPKKKPKKRRRKSRG